MYDLIQILKEVNSKHLETWLDVSKSSSMEASYSQLQRKKVYLYENDLWCK